MHSAWFGVTSTFSDHLETKQKQQSSAYLVIYTSQNTLYYHLTITKYLIRILQN